MHILFCRVARVVAPKKAALKEAEAELAVAMEVSVYNGLSISFQENRSGYFLHPIIPYNLPRRR